MNNGVKNDCEMKTVSWVRGARVPTGVDAKDQGGEDCSKRKF